jgi:CubicO group peptidase (beta-lactamase class C family)
MQRELLRSLIPNLKRRISQIVAERRVPGVSVGLVDDQELVWSEGFGYADIASERRPDEHTIYGVGSITKTFTATAIVQLRDEGKLTLEDPIVRHIPEFASVKCRFGRVEDVTLRRLLTHHSGLQSEPVGLNWDTWEMKTIEEIVSDLPQTEVVIEPDSAFKYSNLGFALLGEVVSRASGRPYVEYTQQEMLEPLGMTASGFRLSDEQRPLLATGYRWSPFSDVPPEEEHPTVDLRGANSAGRLYSTVHDLAKWLSLQFCTDGQVRGSAQVLRGSSLREIHRPQYMEPDWNTGFCLAWGGPKISGEVVLGHGGGVPGFVTQINFSPKHKLGFIALTNGGPASDIANVVADMTFAAVREAPAELQPWRPLPTPAAWRLLLGRYTTPLGNVGSVVHRNGSLRIVWDPNDPGLELEPTEDEKVFVAKDGRWAGEPVRFRVGTDGHVTGFLHYETPYRRLVEAPGWDVHDSDSRAADDSAAGREAR